MRILFLVCFLLAWCVSFGQIESSNAIMDMTTMQTSAPCSICSPWRYDKVNDVLFRWDGSAWVRHGVDDVYARADSVFYTRNGVETFAFVNGGGGASGGWRADEPILRMPTAGDTVPSFDWFYFTAPTISLNVTGLTLVEVGTVNAITLSGSTTNTGGSTLSNGSLRRTFPLPEVEVSNFGAAASYSVPISFTPQQSGSGNYNQLNYTFRTSQDYSGDESGTAQSVSRSIQAVYPVLYGVSATDLTVGGNAYTELTKLIETEGNKVVNMDGTGFIYYAIPSVWSDTDVAEILDANGFNVTGSFTDTTISVSSSGLSNNWTINYQIYKLNNSTSVSNANYTFNL